MGGLIMNLGFDIDGCMNNSHLFNVESGAEFFADKGMLGDVNIKAYGISEMFNVSKELEEEYYNSSEYDFYYGLAVRDNCAEVIKALKRRDYTITIITARVEDKYIAGTTITQGEATRSWLKENGIVYDNLVFGSNKAELCKKWDVDIMLDDFDENIKSFIDEDIPYIVFDNPHNQYMRGIRVEDWLEYLENINEFETFLVEERLAL